MRGESANILRMCEPSHVTTVTSHRFKHLLTATFITLFGSVASAEVVHFNYGEVTLQTLRNLGTSLGTSFVIGCGVLALGLVIAAVISRMK